MIRFLLATFLFIQLAGPAVPADAGNPFQGGGREPAVRESAAGPAAAGVFVRIAQYQQELRLRLGGLIREVRQENSLRPLALILFFAFAYGVVHAAGPGHGKAVAMTYILSQNASIGGGILFGASIALIHGFSGALCVLGLHYILQQSVTGTLASVTTTTQQVSFGLITLLGVWIVFIHVREWFRPVESGTHGNDTKKGKTRLLPWALSVGMVPCPGVVMVMLFCLSMGVFSLGLMAAAAISLGMAVTLSLVVVCVVMGRKACVGKLSAERTYRLEQVLGIASGLAVAGLGIVFFRAAMV
jgi:ABC-type nickel/cobalt efflux system permease component RcnA